MEICEVWSLPYSRVESFFLSQKDVQNGGDGLFSFGDCDIRLTALPVRKIGQLHFPQTQLVFSGPEQDTETIRRRFMLQFISAGG